MLWYTTVLWEEMVEGLLPDNSPQAAEATASSSVWGQKGTVDPTHIELRENIAYGLVQNWLNFGSLGCRQGGGGGGGGGLWGLKPHQFLRLALCNIMLCSVFLLKCPIAVIAWRKFFYTIQLKSICFVITY